MHPIGIRISLRILLINQGGRKLRPAQIVKSMSTKNTLVHVPDEVIMSKIIVIRDKKVLLDRDIAALYGETKND